MVTIKIIERNAALKFVVTIYDGKVLLESFSGIDKDVLLNAAISICKINNVPYQIEV